MNYSVSFLAIALEDVSFAARWYNERRSGLGQDFRLCVEQSIDAIIHAPQLFHADANGFRRVLVRRFPYAVYYRVSGNHIRIYAVFHTRRAPEHVIRRKQM